MDKLFNKDGKKRNLSDLSETSSNSPTLILPNKMSKFMDTCDLGDISVEMSDHDKVDEQVPPQDANSRRIEKKIDEILATVQAAQTSTSFDINLLQDANTNLNLRLLESEGTVVRLSAKVKSLEAKVEALQLHSMKPNLIFHNIPEKIQEDPYIEIDTILRDTLKIPDNLIFSTKNPGGEIRVDVAHRIGQRKSKARPLIVKFLTQRGRDIVFTYAKQLKSTPYAMSEQFPPSVREKRAAQVPVLIEERRTARESKKDSSIKLVKYKLLIDSKVNMNTFEKRPLDYSRSTGDPICFDHMFHSELHEVKGSIFQGHLNPIHTEHEAIQSLSAILQTSLGSKSDHILYAYNFTDAEGLSVNGYYDDGEWTGSKILKELLIEHEIKDAILIVTRLHGGFNLGKIRFEYIKMAGVEALKKL